MSTRVHLCHTPATHTRAPGPMIIQPLAQEFTPPEHSIYYAAYTMLHILCQFKHNTHDGKLLLTFQVATTLLVASAIH